MSHRSAVPLRRERMRESLLTERSHREGARGTAPLSCGTAAVFVLFAWDDSGNTVCGVTPAKMIDMIEDNRYDTILQEYDAVLAELLHTE
ncbi:MAG: hypothetical protein ACLR78_14915 [Roseburia sp.]